MDKLTCYGLKAMLLLAAIGFEVSMERITPETTSWIELLYQENKAPSLDQESQSVNLVSGFTLSFMLY